MSEDKPEPVHEEAAFILDKARGLVRDMLADADNEVAAQIEAASQKGQNESCGETTNKHWCRLEKKFTLNFQSKAIGDSRFRSRAH